MAMSEPGPIRAAVNGAALLLLWLVTAGIGVNEAAIAWWAALTMPVVFLVVHAVLRSPQHVDRSRIRARPSAQLLTFGLPISALLVIGDVLWLIARDQLDREAAPMAAPFVLAVVLLFPLIEEFGFRLWIQTPLEERVGPLPAIILVSVVFAAVHSADFPVPQFVGALGFGVALVATGSIWTAVGMHSVQNGMVAVMERTPAVTDAAIALADAAVPWALPGAVAAWSSAAVLIGIWYTRPRAAKPAPQ